MALNDCPDYFGEEHVLKDLEHFLLDAGLGEESAATAKEKLRVSDFELDPGCPEDPRAVARATRQICRPRYWEIRTRKVQISHLHLLTSSGDV